MKKIIILFSALTFSSAIFAQEQVETKAKAKYSGFVLNGGVSIGSSSANVDNADDGIIDPIVSVSPTVNVGYMLNPHVGFFTGLSLSTYGFKSPMSDIDGNFFNGTLTNAYMEIPVYVRVITSKANKVGFIADIGVSTGFLTGSKLKVSVGGQSEKVDSKEIIKTTSISSLVFLGVKIPVAPIVNIMAGFDSQYCFTEMLKDAEGTKLYRGGLKVTATVKLTNN